MYQRIDLLPSYRYAEICGFQGILAGLLVALKQVSPDTEVTLFQVLKFRAKVRVLHPVKHACDGLSTVLPADNAVLASQHLAGIYVLLACLGSPVWGGVMTTLPPVLFGTYCGWFYLRFLQPKGESLRYL